MEILQNNIGRQYALYANEYEEKALQILRSGQYVLGKEAAAFESEWADYIGSRYCVGLASGLDALILAFRALGISEGDEVIVCANAYIACVMGITINGAVPVFVEPDQYSNIDADRIEEAITAKTRAILAVHLFGQSCDMTRIMQLASQYGLKVVEDCAQSHGSTWKGEKTGSFGDIGCFSFYPTKNCGAFGDAGAIVTDSSRLADTIRVLRNYGSEKRYCNKTVGVNSRLDELQAGLLRVKLKHLEELNRERCHIAETYLKELSTRFLSLPGTRPEAGCTWHQFVIQTEFRDELMEYLQNRGIHTLIHYPVPPHLSEAYRYLGKKRGDFPITEKLAGEILSLPMYNGMKPEEQEYIADTINAFSPKGQSVKGKVSKRASQ